MTLQEILDKAAKKVPNSETDADQVKIIDTLQKRLYRVYGIPNQFDYEILEDQYAYNVGITASKIFDVLVDGESYPKKALLTKTTSTSRYYYFLDGLLIIYPTPTADGTLSVFAYETPETLTSSDMSVSPALDSDFHDIFVYGLSIELAENANQYDKVREFKVEYRKLEGELAEVFAYAPEVMTIQSESGW